MSEGSEKIKINVWINEERMEALKSAGLGEMAKEEFAGMKLLEIYCTEEQKDEILREFPTAKYDSSTTHSIELLPREVKDMIFDASLKSHSTGPDVVKMFLENNSKKNH